MAIKKIAVFVLFLFVPLYPACSDGLPADSLKIFRFEPPAPRLIEPIKDTVDLTAKASLVRVNMDGVRTRSRSLLLRWSNVDG